MTKKRRARTKFQRRLAGLLALAIALLGIGTLYSFARPGAADRAGPGGPGGGAQGEQIYNNTCISCHGANLEGVKDRGPSLVGIGEAAVYFQTSTGRMPAVMQGAQAQEKPPVLTPEEVDAVARVRPGQRRRPGDARGAGRGAAGRQPRSRRPALPAQLRLVPQLHRPRRRAVLRQVRAARWTASTEEQMYAAMLSGPESMPRFSERQLTPEEKKDIIAYVKSVDGRQQQPRRRPIGGLGPQSEGLIGFIVGIAALLGITLVDRG